GRAGGPLVVELVDRGTGERAATVEQAELRPDALRRARVVAGHHDEPDAGLPQPLYGAHGGCAYRVGESDEAAYDEVAHLLVAEPAVGRDRCLGHGEDAQPAAGEPTRLAFPPLCPLGAPGPGAGGPR